MCRFNEISVNMQGRKFYKSSNGNMVLTQSRCKGLISLVNFDKEEKNEEYMKLMAWKIKSRTELPISDNVNYALS